MEEMWCLKFPAILNIWGQDVMFYSRIIVLLYWCFCIPCIPNVIHPDRYDIKMIHYLKRKSQEF